MDKINNIEEFMQDNSILYKNIGKLGEVYKKKHLNEWDKNKLETDWWYATNFFFNHSFMRGRVDTVSLAYWKFTKIVLERLFGHGESPPTSILMKYKDYFDRYPDIKKFKKGRENIIGKEKLKEFHKAFNENIITNTLTNTIRTEELRGNNPICLENDKDLLMVIHYFKHLTSNNIDNIYLYIIKKIEEGKIKEVYKELDSIDNIGDKLATFIIRDIGLLNEGLIKEKDFQYAIPVDTWVQQIYNLLQNSSEEEIRGPLTSKRIKTIKNWIIDICSKNNIDGLKFAAGLWVLGYHSLDLLMKNYLNKEFNGHYKLDFKSS